MYKKSLKVFKSLLFKNQTASTVETYLEASIDSLLKSWSPGLGWGHNETGREGVWRMNFYIRNNSDNS